jgi:phage tail protein X
MFVEYITRDGDRWDLIAEAAYGDPWAFGPIIEANPDVPIRPVLPGGLRLLLPVREQAPTPAAELPPWKR